LRQLNTGAYLIRMQKINTEIYTNICSQENQADIRNPCCLSKIRRIFRILAFLQKSGGFSESLRFYKNQGDLQNPCAFLKIRGIHRILALF
jgi:hypothetical protein